MNDTVVSIRIPHSLLLELKFLSEKKHFLDISEEVRSIVRKKWLTAASPDLMVLKEIKADIREQIEKKSQKAITAKVLKELENIKKQLKKEDYIND